MRQKRPTSVAVAAVIVGLLIVAAAAGEYYGISWVRARMIRMSSWTGIAAALAPPAEREQLLRSIGISEGVLLAWSCVAWTAMGLLGLAGLWTTVRRRFGWRMLWVGAIATIVAAALTLVGIYVLENYTHSFEKRDWRFHTTAFLVHSAPGWVILGMWLVSRWRRRAAGVEVAAEAGADTTAVASNGHGNNHNSGNSHGNNNSHGG